uniref:Uncharacterized protein n=1 Tax=Anopheles merus TaxID=30066 RepID=A0A182VHU1_ANOME
MPIHQWCGRRERGLGPRFGDADTIHRTIYRSLEPKKIWNDPGRFPGIVRDYGGAFNLEFSPDGTLLVAACQKKSIVLFDPLTEIQICAVKNAHTECVNCIKFIDHQIFATCSDDTTVALWDIRNLTTKLRTLNGHSGWVKNIEYSKRDRMLLSSGFDGSVYGWEINNYTEYGSVYRRVLHTSGLLRSRLSPDESRLVLSMSSGYLIIIHDLDLANLAGDLEGFYPNVYRLMQVGRQLIPMAARFRHLFYSKRKKNRIELVTDFPPNNNPEMISSLAIHPQGWCTLTRNVSSDEMTEWSVVHDIQELPHDEESDEDEEELAEREQNRREDDNDQAEESSSSGVNVARDPQPGTSGMSGRSARGSELGGMFRLNVTMREMMSSVESHREPAVGSNEANANAEDQGFIRESCFSPDGRIICSPHDHGFRLLAFNENCNELQHATGIWRNEKAQQLHEVKRKQCHSSLVVSSQFSPRFPLLVTGCLLGKIVWHQPALY